MKPLYTQILTPDERAACIRFGMIQKQAELSMDKSAGPIGGTVGALNASTKLILTTSLLTGIPLGIAAHAISQQVNKSRLKERELRERIKYYDRATNQLSQGLEV